MKNLEIRADCKSYSEWSINEEGDLLHLKYEFEGHDIISYKIFNIDTLDTYDEFDTFEEAKTRLQELTK